MLQLYYSTAVMCSHSRRLLLWIILYRRRTLYYCILFSVHLTCFCAPFIPTNSDSITAHELLPLEEYLLDNPRSRAGSPELWLRGHQWFIYHTCCVGCSLSTNSVPDCTGMCSAFVLVVHTCVTWGHAFDHARHPCLCLLCAVYAVYRNFS